MRKACRAISEEVFNEMYTEERTRLLKCFCIQNNRDIKVVCPENILSIVKDYCPKMYRVLQNPSNCVNATFWDLTALDKELTAHDYKLIICKEITKHTIGEVGDGYDYGDIDDFWIEEQTVLIDILDNDLILDDDIDIDNSLIIFLNKYKEQPSLESIFINTYYHIQFKSDYHNISSVEKVIGDNKL